MSAKVVAKPSKVELTKLASAYLRGTLGEELATDAPSITEDAASVLKFHGSYQQDDRDVRAQNRREGKDKAHQFMVRIRMPGGRLASAQQYLACDELARTLGNGTLRITTRQEFQLHGVLKHDLKAVIGRINRICLSTLAACGDVERNVLACPMPAHDERHRQLQQDCAAFASHFAPRSSSYYDIWLDGERIANPNLPTAGPIQLPTADDDPVEPIYGKAYLPRKFKTAFAFADDNCTDVHANDLGFLAVVENDSIVGYNVLVGGGLGTTPSAGKTFPFLGVPLAYVPRADCIRVGEAVIKAFRDLGNRSDRKRARLKYVIHDLGLPAFRSEVEGYFGAALEDARDIEVEEVEDHMGWQEQGDGKLSLGLPIENGRIADVGPKRTATALRTFFERYGTPARLTCQQSILLIDIERSWKADIEKLLRDHGAPMVESISTARRWSMACPALPTCGLAVTEAERALPSLMDEIDGMLERMGLQDERFTVRMTGCPNGCARPYNADIGLVGRSATKNEDGTNSAGTYTIFLGGSTLGHRLNGIYKDYVPFDQIVAELATVFERFVNERVLGEAFGDFCHRVAIAKPYHVPVLAVEA